MSMPLRIVKVGGSLFSLPDLAERLQRWLCKQSAARNVLVAGGGPLADVVRAWDERFQLGEETSHWLCVDLLNVTASALRQLLKTQGVDCQLADSLDQFSATPLTIFAPAQFLRDQELGAAGGKLPHCWRVTSDSIAVKLAEVCQADELVLLKSSPPPTNSHALAELGCRYVDEHFPEAAKSLPKVRFVDLGNS